MGEMQRKANVQMDFLKGQLSRRDQELAKLRERFFKELLLLKEQLYKKGRGEEVDSYSMPWDKAEDASDQERNNNEQMIQKMQKSIRELRDKQREEIRLLELKYQEEIKKLQQLLADYKQDFQSSTSNVLDREAEMSKLKKEISSLQLEKSDWIKSEE